MPNHPCSRRQKERNLTGEEAGEVRRKRPSRYRVKLNAVAVWELLDQLGITQKELARRSGISGGYLSQLIRGERSPSPRVQLRLQQALGVTDWDRLFILEPAGE